MNRSNVLTRLTASLVVVPVVLLVSAWLTHHAAAQDAPPQGAPDQNARAPVDPSAIKDIKSYCLDFNWGARRSFAGPGTWKNTDPQAFVAWHRQIGANVIQTFAVSCNGYAWYRGGPVPEQPGLKHDFLREVVKLGHAEGMAVMAYFCVGANTRWGAENPALSYGTPSKVHIPYTDEYLKYLDSAITDAVKTTGIDGFMIDWLWQPSRDANGGKWLDAEKKLYEQLMSEPFPGEDKLTAEQDLAYSRKAIDRCWKTIHKAAKQANPNVIIWLTVNKMTSPHVINSDMYRQVDWLMAEAGRMREIEAVKPMIGPHTRLITCMAQWNGQDPKKAVPEAAAANVGLYGFARPGASGTIPLDDILPRQLSELTGDAQNIAVLARVYHGKSLHSEWRDGDFVEPENPPLFDITLNRRGRGLQDAARIDADATGAIVTVTTPYQAGRAELRRTGDHWPATLRIRLNRKPEGDRAGIFRMANGALAFATSLDDSGKTQLGALKSDKDMTRSWGPDFALDPLPAGNDAQPPEVRQSDEYVEIAIPPAMTRDNPDALVFEWAKTPADRIR